MAAPLFQRIATFFKLKEMVFPIIAKSSINFDPITKKKIGGSLNLLAKKNHSSFVFKKALNQTHLLPPTVQKPQFSLRKLELIIRNTHSVTVLRPLFTQRIIHTHVP
jgi:hypothetical protein